MFIGNQHLIEDFKKLAEGGKLAHGYIFFGEPQVGKFTFARSLANFLENKKFDLPERILSDSLAINEKNREGGGIDLARMAKIFLSQRPALSSKRMAIIDEADKLTPEAQNAILKIAEEPPMGALIILITSQPANLLPPLLSRLQKIYFSRTSEEEIAKFLIESRGVGAKKAAEAAGDSCGRAGRAVDLLENALMAEAKKSAEKFLDVQSPGRSRFIKDLVEIQKENPKFLDYFFEFVIIGLRKDPIKNLDMLKSCLNRLFLIKSYNTNKRLQIEAII
ncbi:MAG: AAA family ATPase [Candidatus Pacebacteria bacterium]|nr:AAA family ATPase [Candidatus Paceibacterota bacterium]